MVLLFVLVFSLVSCQVVDQGVSVSVRNGTRYLLDVEMDSETLSGDKACIVGLSSNESKTVTVWARFYGKRNELNCKAWVTARYPDGSVLSQLTTFRIARGKREAEFLIEEALFDGRRLVSR
jgi:hypothetical protein